MTDRLVQTPGTLAAQPVMVIGEALVDEFEDGARVAGGAAFNLARWLGVLGVPTRMVTRIGAGDAAGLALRASAQRCGLSSEGFQVDPLHATGRVQVRLAAEGPSYTIDANAAWDHIDVTQAVQLATQMKPAVLVFNTLGQRSADSAQAVQAVLDATPALRFADLNLRPAAVGGALQGLVERTLQQADWIKVNDEELAQLLRWFVTDGSLPEPGPGLDDAQRALVLKFGLQRCIVTCAERGWYTLDATGACDDRGPAPAVAQLVDTVGAGDAFSAVVVTGLAAGWPLAASLRAAARLAGAVCGQRGAVPEDDLFLNHWRQQLGVPADAGVGTCTGASVGA